VPQPIPHSLVRRLREVPIFADLDDETLLTIVGDAANLRWSGDEVIFAVGEQPEALYVVLRGEVVILDEDAGEVTRLERGGYFGEQSLLAGTAHSKTARTLTDTELMVVPRATFEALLEADPALHRDVEERLEERLAERTSGSTAG
jgi:CRP-like cAMP-binding protein